MIREGVITQVMTTRNSKKVVLARLTDVQKSLKVYHSSFFGKYCHECSPSLSPGNMQNDQRFTCMSLWKCYLQLPDCIKFLTVLHKQSFGEFK